MKIIAVLSLAMAIVLPAGSEGNGFELWTPSQLKPSKGSYRSGWTRKNSPPRVWERSATIRS